MGLGTLRLYTGTDVDPRELLSRFALFEDFPLEVLNSHEDLLSEIRAYLIETDCSLTMHCSTCGVPMCPGCGSAPTVGISIDGWATARCPSCPRDTILAGG